MSTPSEREIPAGPRSIASGERRPIVLQANGIPWNGPGEPQRSVIPAGSATRGWSYPIFWNASGDPRSSKAQESGGISFGDLEALSNQVHVRAAIETVKNTQCKKQWVFQLRPLPGERQTDVARRAASDPRIAELTAFFEEPDGEHDLAEWLRLLLEDLLVLDAPTLYNLRRNSGAPYEVEVFPGSTIKPLLAEDGRTPRTPQPAYQQWLYGSPGEAFTTEVMMYAPRNPRPGKAMGRSPVEQLLFYINIALRKDLQRLATYTDGNIPAGMLPMPEKWSPAEIKDWWGDFNIFVKGLPQQLVKLVPIPGGTGVPIFPSLTSNVDSWEESWTRLVCFAFDIPVQALVKEMNRATAEVGRDSAEQDGAAGYTDWIRRLLNRVIRRWFGYADIVAISKREADVESKTQAEIDDLEIKTGTLQINEKREREGRPPLTELDGRVGYFGPMGFTEFTVVPVPIQQSAASPEIGVVAETVATPAVEFNGAQVTAATGIVEAVATGTIPRDSGIGQLIEFFGKTPDQAEAIMGSAGRVDVPTTPNPHPADVATPGDVPTAITTDIAKAYDYASTQVNLVGDVAAGVLDLAASIPDEALAEKGREDRPHVTVKYGIAPTVTAGEVRTAIGRDTTGQMTLGATAFFAAPDYDVVILPVVSEDLHRLNTAITNGVETISTQANYVPHITLAYVKSGRGHEFAGNGALVGITIAFVAIHYLDPAGQLTKLASVKPHVRLSPLKKDAGPDLREIISAAFTIVRADDKTLGDLAAPFHIEAVKAGAKQVGSSLGLEAVVGIDSPEVTQFLADKANQIVSVNEETAVLINDKIGSLVGDGATPESVSNAIAEAFDLRKAQADLIGRQEVGSALSGGRWLETKARGIKRHQWLTSGLDNVRPTHAAQNKQIVDVGEPFANGLLYPQDPAGDGDEVIGCNCIALPVSDEEEKAATPKEWTAAREAVQAIADPMALAIAQYFDDQCGRVITALKDAGLAA